MPKSRCLTNSRHHEKDILQWQASEMITTLRFENSTKINSITVTFVAVGPPASVGVFATFLPPFGTTGVF
ncbi:MAG TPA: hypothetical protein DEA22_11925 [Blastocatellia bacterium]|nr:hypothetical protein [Blastocatellia bacterium]